MNVAVEKMLLSRIHQLEKQLTHAIMKIELISGFLKKKFIDASFPIKMLGAVSLKRVKLVCRKVRRRPKKSLRKATANDKVGHSCETGTTTKVKYTPTRNVEEFEHGLAVEIEDEIQTQTSAELLNETSGRGGTDGANKNTFGVTDNDCNEGVEMESTVTIKNVTGEASKRSVVQAAELKRTISVRLERMQAGPKDSSLSKHGVSNKRKILNSQQAFSASKVGEKLFKCTWEDCPRRFTGYGHLERHWRVHTGEKPFKCTWAHCTRRFTQKHHLIDHLRTHSGEKPFKCSWPDCEKSFAKSSTLVSHRRIHTGERPYSCTFCGEVFLHRNTFVSHLRLHTCEKPYKCDICGDAFRCNQSLRCHKKRRHNYNLIK